MDKTMQLSLLLLLACTASSAAAPQTLRVLLVPGPSVASSTRAFWRLGSELASRGHAAMVRSVRECLFQRVHMGGPFSSRGLPSPDCPVPINDCRSWVLMLMMGSLHLSRLQRLRKRTFSPSWAPATSQPLPSGLGPSLRMMTLRCAP